MRRKRGQILFFSFILMTMLVNSAYAVEMKGYLNTGIWYLKNDLASDPTYTSNDGYGQSYVQGDFSMLNASLKLDFLQLNDPNSSSKISAHLKARGLYNLQDNPYSLAPPNRYRYQFDEANVEINSGITDLWIGRHTLYEAGGVGVDGITSIFNTGKHTGLGVYGGLGNDPRTLTGYIGPSYETTPFTADFLAFGGLTKIHYDKFQMDVAVNSLLFKNKIDRSNLYTQINWGASELWRFSGYLDAGFMGDKGLQKGLLMITTKITPKLTNRFSFSEFRSLFYKASDASGIPVNVALNPIFPIGTVVDTSEYYYLRDEIQYRFDRNYMFTGVEFGHRTFDSLDRFKYTLGYFDPQLFGSRFDLKIQTDIIDNYLSFNSDIDLMIGRYFGSDTFRVEVGGTFYANERDSVVGGVVVNSTGEIEKETTGRVNFIYNATNRLSWILNYAYYKEIDVFNNFQHVHTHEIYFSTNVRF